MQELGLNLPAGAPLSLTALVVNLGVGLVLSLLLRWHFQRFGSTLSNRTEFAQVFPLIVMTTVLIITVVKSSLALSLGLVGALSIVRFRTPIKEPEELAYLFIAIATGLGLGADQTLPTVLAVGVILAAVGALRAARAGREETRLYLNLDWNPSEGQQRAVDAVGEVISRHSSTGDLRRIDSRGGSVSITYFLDVPNPKTVSDLIEDLQQSFPGMGVTFIDQNQLPSV
ncbi:MAG: DUF4956 domain-containing protein [Proteobacteria bacterium]|nr:DUF4956 domain-containing protein [Pseudomonadota bacterium]